MYSHILTLHSSGRAYVCVICGDKFKLIKDLNQHTKECKFAQERIRGDDDTKIYFISAPVFGDVIKFLMDLENGQLLQVPQEEEEWSPSSSSVDDCKDVKIMPPGDLGYLCSACGKGFPSEMDLLAHEVVQCRVVFPPKSPELDVKLHECKMAKCGQFFATETALQE